MDYPTTRAEAMASGATHYFTGQPCKRGHVALRKTKGACTECMREDWAAAAASRAEYFREYNRRTDVRDARNDWYLQHREEVIQRAKDRPVADKRRYRATWKANNPDLVAAHAKNRRRKHRHATPPWITAKQRMQMRDMYRVARVVTATTGVEHVVDHIFPLGGETSCGLHVPWNLRVIPRAENLAKSNLIPDQWALAFPDGSGPHRG